jgi:hypothetical protein
MTDLATLQDLREAYAAGESAERGRRLLMVAAIRVEKEKTDD